MRSKRVNVEVNEVLRMASGREYDILRALAGAELEQALNKKIGMNVPCPVYGGKDGFRFLPKFNPGAARCQSPHGPRCSAKPYGDFLATLQFVKGWTFPETLQEVAEYLNMDADTPYRPKPGKAEDRTRPARVVPKQPIEEQRKLRRKMVELWDATVPLTAREAEPARLYLVSRGIDLKNLSPYLRFHRQIPYWYTPDGSDEIKLYGRFPGIIVKFYGPTGLPATLHRTYLSPDGRKAEVPTGECRKVMMRPDSWEMMGGAMYLDRAGEILNVGEGVETMLSVRQSNGFPTWATGSHEFLAGLVIPPCVRTLLIWADCDRGKAGQTSAGVLLRRAREAGINVKAYVPSEKMMVGTDAKGIDWNDAYQRGKEGAFPDLSEVLAKHRALRAAS